MAEKPVSQIVAEMDMYSVSNLIEVLRVRCRNFVMSVEDPTNAGEMYYTVWGESYYTSLGLAHGLIAELENSLYENGEGGEDGYEEDAY